MKTSYLDRLLEPVAQALTPDVARAIVNVRADQELQKRIEYLRLRAEMGTLTPGEEAEYKDFVEAVDVMSIIQSKARKFLATHSE